MYINFCSHPPSQEGSTKNLALNGLAVSEKPMFVNNGHMGQGGADNPLGSNFFHKHNYSVYSVIC